MKNRNLSKILTAAVLTLSVASFAESGWGHPGRTNASGCHNDHRNGGYHCQNGSGSGSGSSGSESPSRNDSETALASQRFVYKP